MGTSFGISRFEMLGALAPIMTVGPMLVWLVLLGPLVVYPVARWKAHREQVLDPQLGIKFALHYFALIAFQLVLFATMLAIYTLFRKAGGKGDLYRMAFALLIPAGGVLAAHRALLRRTNEDVFPGVRRLFLGYNLLLTGLIGFAMLVFAFQVFFAKGPADDMGRLAIAGVLVYTGAWAACGIQFGRIVMGAPASPANQTSTSTPVQVPPQPSGPVLPSLGAGSFPPIDQK